MHTLIPVTKNFGEPMALVQTGIHEAVLVLINRFEKGSKYISLPNHTHKYTVIRFERRPELCGVKEPSDPKTHAKLHNLLHKKFLKALISTCLYKKINIVYCVDVNVSEASPYKTALNNSGITLKELD